MRALSARSAGRLACAALLALALAAPAMGQAPGSSYEVRRGDTLFAIARKARPEGVSVNQMLVAIYRANAKEFPDGSIGVLRPGQVLRIPGREEAAAIPPAEARREVQALIAKPAAPRPAVEPKEPPVPKPPAKAPAKPPAKALLGPEEAETRYQEGLALERRGDDRGALKAFLEAGESGHGLAQRKLGEIYDKGNPAVARDYETALRWYQRAREQGVPIPKPLPRFPH